MKNSLHFFKATLFVIAALFSSCSERDIPEELLNNEQNTSQPVYTDLKESLPADNAGFLLHIRTEQSWTIEVDQDWCTLLRTSGSGNASVMGSVSKNTTDQMRSAVITVRIAGISYPLTINRMQAKKEDRPVQKIRTNMPKE